MEYYNELPDDFHNHWLQNMIYELFLKRLTSILG